jgi:hypothetical protein
VPRELREVLREVRDAFAPTARRASGARGRAGARAARAVRGADYAARALAQSPRVLAGLGPRRAEQLAKRGIHTVEDLLYRLPAGYDDRRTLASVGRSSVGVARHVRGARARQRPTRAGAGAARAAGGCSKRR